MGSQVPLASTTEGAPFAELTASGAPEVLIQPFAELTASEAPEVLIQGLF